MQGTKTNNGWNKRDDFFEEAGEWLCRRYRKRAELLCEAGFSEIGDPILLERPHIILDGQPLLHLEMLNTSEESVIEILRWGRSLRLLGLITETLNDDFSDKRNESKHLFLCDIFDGDSILMVELK